MSKSSKLFRSLGILSMGIMITIGGIYLWNNNFDVNLFSNAGTQKIQTIIVIGDTNETDNMSFVNIVENQLEAEYGRDIKVYTGYSDTITLPLKDQLVSAYQKMPQPIEGKVIFIVLTGQKDIKKGLENNNSSQAISQSIKKNLEDMLALPKNRPGVFPDGFTVYTTDIYDPTDGLINSSTCNSQYKYNSQSESSALATSIKSMLVDLDNTMSDKLHVVQVKDSFVGHAAGAATEDLKWLTDCETLTEEGKNQLAGFFIEDIVKYEK